MGLSVCVLTGAPDLRLLFSLRIGKCGDRTGFFPTNFVQRVRLGETVWKSIKTFHGVKEQGQLTLKEGQVCVGVEKPDSEGLIRVSSGKKRGLVPQDCLVEI